MRESFAIVIDNRDGMVIYSIESSYLPRYITQISVSGISVATHSVFGNGNESFPKGFGIQFDPAFRVLSLISHGMYIPKKPDL